MSEDWEVNLAKWEGWQIMILEEGGIPLKFSPNMLTDEQKNCLILTHDLGGLVEQGLLKVIVKDGGVFFQLTEKGKLRDG